MSANSTTNKTLAKGFKRLKEGFANIVYVDKEKSVILKIYSKEKYFNAELGALNSGFKHMPKLIKYGFIEGKPYTMQSYIGEPVKNSKSLNHNQLAKTIADLHQIHTTEKNSETVLEKFCWLKEYRKEIRDLTNISIEELLESTAERVKKFKKPPSLVHGDINLSNIRIVNNTYYLIDFDEAWYSHPLFDFAKLYWCKEAVLSNKENLEKMVNEYNFECTKNSQIKDINEVGDFVLLSGIEIWCWRYENLEKPNYASQIAKELKRYLKNYG